MKMTLWLPLLLVSLSPACASSRAAGPHSPESAEPPGPEADGEEQGEDDDSSEQEVPLSELPEAVRKAALAAVPGIELRAAEMETKGGQRIYEIEGVADGVEHEIEIDAAGTVLEVEKKTDKE
jgi:hypothetical protein